MKSYYHHILGTTRKGLGACLSPLEYARNARETRDASHYWRQEEKCHVKQAYSSTHYNTNGGRKLLSSEEGEPQYKNTSYPPLKKVKLEVQSKEDDDES
jgi:hypothetical protein